MLLLTKLLRKLTLSKILSSLRRMLESLEMSQMQQSNINFDYATHVKCKLMVLSGIRSSYNKRSHVTQDRSAICMNIR